MELMKLVREVPVASHVKDYAVRLVLATPSEDGYGRADCQPVSALRQQPARRPDVAARGQGPRPHRWPLQRQLR